MAMNGWIGVDLDGTLAVYNGWVGPTHIGLPIPAMVERVKNWLNHDIEVRIFTARVFPGGRVDSEELAAVEKAIAEWCMSNFGRELRVTCTKDFGMIELWDDRCVQVVPNTGERADGQL